MSKYGQSDYEAVRMASTSRETVPVEKSVDKTRDLQTFQSLFSQRDHKNDISKNAARSPFICGSGSASRRLILEAAGFNFDVVKADIDERAIGDRSSGSLESAQSLVMLLGHMKADAIMQRLKAEPRWRACLDATVAETQAQTEDAEAVSAPRPHRVLITADQVVICNGDLLEKPLDETEARAMLALYAQHPCSTVGSLVLTNLQNGKRYERQDTSTVHFKPRTEGTGAQAWDTAIDNLIAEGMCFHCAGALMIENPILLPLIQRVEGCEESVMGMDTKLLEQVFSDFEADADRAGTAFC